MEFDNLPSHWHKARVDRVASVNARIGWKALTAAEYLPDGYAFLATPNIKTRDIDFENVNYISEFRYEESPELKLTEGDVLLAKDGNTLGITNVVRSLPRPATVNGSIAVLRPFGIDSRFLHYVLASNVVQGIIGAVKDGMGVPHLFQWDIKRLPVPLPPLTEQQQIADFLDAETARVDRIYARQTAVLQKLDERDRAVRDQLVDQLVCEVGEIPLRRWITRIEQGVSPQCEGVPRVGDDWGVLKLSAVKGGFFNGSENKRLPDHAKVRPEYEVRRGDLLVTRANTPALVGDAAVVSEQVRRLLLPDLIYRVGLVEGIDAEFVAQAILSSRVRQLIEAVARGSSQSMVKIRGEDIKSWPVPAASLSQQRNIIREITLNFQFTDRLKKAVHRSLTVLAERRQALITAAVTGGIDVSTTSGRALTDLFE
jgi:type I restriction enzyme S subunit